MEAVVIIHPVDIDEDQEADHMKDIRGEGKLTHFDTLRLVCEHDGFPADIRLYVTFYQVAKSSAR